MVIYLNGSINAGKTTVGRRLASMLPRAVFVDIDDLPAPPGLTLDDSIVPLLDDAAGLAAAWDGRGFHAIVAWPVTDADFERFESTLKKQGIRVAVFTLAPLMEKALTNRGERELTDWERERIRYHYATGIPNLKAARVIDNTELTAQQTAERIVRELRL